MVKAKKHLGQHFLKDKNIAAKIADSLPAEVENVLEIGPGTGVLTQMLQKKSINLKVIEIDNESVDFLAGRIIESKDIIADDFLRISVKDVFGGKQFAVIGNYPYNISSRIVFRAVENRDMIPVFAGMFQKEVAERIAMKPGSKLYGILSVITQAFYEVEYLFSVPPTVFIPPPKVNSGVIRMIRKEDYSLSCNEDMFFKVVKTAFNQRRKMLRSSLKNFVENQDLLSLPVFTKRPEQLDYKEFVKITKMIAK